MTHAELAGAGFSRTSIRGLVSRGVLTRVRHGAYAKADLAAGLDDRTVAIAAAVAVAGEDAVASHEDAALLHGIAQLRRPRADLMSVSRSAGHDRLLVGPPAVRVRSASLPANQIALACDVGGAGRHRPGQVHPVQGCRRRRGLGAVPRQDDQTRPPPELQIWVGGYDRPIGRVDFLWPQHATIAEADGAVKYADPGRARQQLHRDAELRDAGFEVVPSPGAS